MNNAELIKALRNHRTCDDDECTTCELMNDAAAALEAAEQRIAKLSLDNKMLKNTIDADKGVMLDRICFLEAQMPKEAHWVAVDNGHGVCSNCNRQDSIDNMATHCRYCGAKMKGANDEN